MNSLGRPFFPPAQPPAPPPPAPGIDHTTQLPTTLTATIGSFLDPLNLSDFAQTSKHNHRGAEMAVRARLKQECRTLPQPLAQFADPTQRLDTAVPIDQIGLDHLRSRGVQGPLSIELVKSGACSIQEIERRAGDIEAFILCPEVDGDEIFGDVTVFDYIVADKVCAEQVYELRGKLTEEVIKILRNDTVRECLKKSYLTFEQALNLKDSDVNVLNTDVIAKYVKEDVDLNINELLVRTMITREFADNPTDPSIETTIQVAAGMDFSVVRSRMEALRSSMFTGSSTMHELD